MNQDLTTALYEAMAKEQANFRDWLVKQPPEEILNHTYEYTVREDILMAMEELELPREQGEALLSSPSPLADVYRHFSDLETGYMDLIRDSIESRARKRPRNSSSYIKASSIRTTAHMRGNTGNWNSTAPPGKPILPARRLLKRSSGRILMGCT